MVRAFVSDGATVVGKIDRLLFGRDVDMWIAVWHDWKFYCGGPPSDFFAANAEFFSLIKRYSPMPWRRWHRWFGVTAFAWGWLPHPARWGFGWKYPATQGDVNAGEFTLVTEEPAFFAAMVEANAPPEIMRKLFGNGWFSLAGRRRRERE